MQSGGSTQTHRLRVDRRTAAAPAKAGAGPAEDAALKGVRMLAHELARHRESILERWIGSVMDAYPDETAKFLKKEGDPFSNPVGAGLREGLADIVAGLAGDVGHEVFEPALDRVIRVRAVQDFSPAAAVGFVFDLKRIVREELDPSIGDLSELDGRIDRLGLQAFDVYMRCREQVWAIRAKEIRSQSLGILERMQEWREKRFENSENQPP